MTGFHGSRFTNALWLAHLGIDPVGAHDWFVRNPRPLMQVGPPFLRVTYLLGSEGNQFIFDNPDLFEAAGAFETLEVLSGKTALIQSKEADHRRRRRMVAGAFTPRRVDQYRAIFEKHAHGMIDRWSPGDILDVAAELRAAVRHSTVEALLGSRVASHETEIAAGLQPGLDLAGDDLLRYRLRRRLHTRGWRAANEGRDRVASQIMSEIRMRRRESALPDVLGTLLSAQAEDGSAPTDEEIVDQAISLIAAGYATTSAALGWAAHLMLSRPGFQTHPVEHVVAEVLRLHPPAVISARRAVEALDFGDVAVARGQLVLFSPYVTHRLPEMWFDPLRYDPTRWDRSRPGFRRPSPTEYLPFGGGAHRCVGAHFATAQMSAVLTALQERVTLRGISSKEPRPANLAAMRPKGPVLARVESVP